ncbi:hypothetical protein OPQ81_009705 [Rhizoctonia solani]|nr:hypothetical protein OPQ81_009705 [Rhizoctonia solani]
MIIPYGKPTEWRIGGSQVQPSSFSTSDVSTDRPTPTTANSSSVNATITSATATSPLSGSATVSGSGAPSSPTTTSNAAIQRFSVSPIGLFGILVFLTGTTLL